MPKRTSGIENKVLNSRESKAKEPFSLNKKSVAFTLAEVLITLAIIGVVAALTIPTVVASYQKKQYYTQFMKIYNTLNEAVDLSVVDNGEISQWDYSLSPDDFINTYIKDYLKISSVESIPTYALYKLDGSEAGKYNQLLEANGSHASAKVYNLADSSSISIAYLFDELKTFVFICDTNGPKAPNTFGRDIFGIEVKMNEDKTSHVIESQWKSGDDNDSCSVDGSGGDTGIKGIGCADRLLKEGKMDY